MTINEGKNAFFATALSKTGVTQDLESEWLKTHFSPTPFSTIDMWMDYLFVSGYTTGTLQERQNAWLKDGHGW